MWLESWNPLENIESDGKYCNTIPYLIVSVVLLSLHCNKSLQPSFKKKEQVITMLPQIQIRIQIQIQIMPTPVPAPRDGDVSTKSCQLVLPTILINVFYISTHFRIQVALKNVNISKISTQIPIQACSLCILHFKVTVLYEYGYTKYTIIYC